MNIINVITRLYRNVVIDLRYGRFLGGVKKTPFADVGAYDTANSDYEVLGYLFKKEFSSLIANNDVLVDIGCGKGRVLNFWLSNFPENKIYGIELDPEVLSATSKRLSNFSNVTLLCGNAINLIPSDGTLFYLFNPFDESVIIRFLNSLHKSIYFSENKKISIVYYNPVHINVFFEDVACNVKEIVLPARFHKAFLIELHSRVR